MQSFNKLTHAIVLKLGSKVRVPRGVTVHAFAPNRQGTDVRVRCLQSYKEHLTAVLLIREEQEEDTLHLLL